MAAQLPPQIPDQATWYAIGIRKVLALTDAQAVADPILDDLDTALGLTSTIQFLMFTAEDIAKIPPVGSITPVRIKTLIRLRRWASPARTFDEWDALTPLNLVEMTEEMNIQEENARIAMHALALRQDNVVTAKEAYKKRVKVDTKAYIEFKSEDKFRTWRRITQMTAKNQGIYKVFDKKFDPLTLVTPEEKEEFQAHQETAMEILVTNCKTINSLAIVRRHVDAGTAHACFKEMYEYYLTGNNAERAAAKAKSKVRDMRLTNDYERSLVGFFTLWENNLLDYEEFTGKTVTDEEKKKWLTESVRVNDKFRQEVNSASRIRDAQGEIQPFKDWYAQLKEFAAETDDVNAALKPTRKIKVNSTDTNTRGTGRGGAGKGGGRGSGRGGRGAGRGDGGVISIGKQRLIAPEVWKTWSAEKKAAHVAKTRRL